MQNVHSDICISYSAFVYYRKQHSGKTCWESSYAAKLSSHAEPVWSKACLDEINMRDIEEYENDKNSNL